MLETKHRLNVGGQNVTDLLLRTWIPDDSYLTYAGKAKNYSYPGQIKARVGDDAHGPNATGYTAPSDVYGTAKEIISSNASSGDFKLLNITWSLQVQKNIDHLLRLHFCDLWNSQSALTVFNLSIYDSYVMPVNNDTNVSTQLPAPYFL